MNIKLVNVALSLLLLAALVVAPRQQVLASPASTLLRQVHEWSGADILIIIDQSDSERTTDQRNVRGDVADYIITEATRDSQIPGRNKKHRASVVLFGSANRTAAYPGGWADLTSTAASSALKDWIDAEIGNLRGLTSYRSALDVANDQLKKDPKPENKQLVVFISDGAPQESVGETGQLGRHVDEMCRRIAEYNLNTADAIHEFLMVGYTSESGEPPLEQLRKLVVEKGCVDGDKAMRLQSSAEIYSKINPILQRFFEKEKAVIRETNKPFFVAPYLSSATFLITRQQENSISPKLYYFGSSGAQPSDPMPNVAKSSGLLFDHFSIADPSPGWWVVCADPREDVELQTTEAKYLLALNTNIEEVAQFQPLNLSVQLVKSKSAGMLQEVPDYPITLMVSANGQPAVELKRNNDSYPLPADLINTGRQGKHQLYFKAEAKYSEPSAPEQNPCGAERAVPAPGEITTSLAEVSKELTVAPEGYQAKLLYPGPDEIIPEKNKLHVELQVANAQGNPLTVQSAEPLSYTATVMQGGDEKGSYPLTKAALDTFKSQEFTLPPVEAAGNEPYTLKFSVKSGSETLIEVPVTGNFIVSSLSPNVQVLAPRANTKIEIRQPSWSFDFNDLFNGTRQPVEVEVQVMQGSQPKNPADMFDNPTQVLTATLGDGSGKIVRPTVALSPSTRVGVFTARLDDLPVGQYQLVTSLNGDANFPGGRTKPVSIQDKVDFSIVESPKFAEQQNLLRMLMALTGLILALLIAWLIYRYSSPPKGYLEVTAGGSNVGTLYFNGRKRTFEPSGKMLQTNYAPTLITRIKAKKGPKDEEGKNTVRLWLHTSSDGVETPIVSGETIRDGETIGLEHGMRATYHGTGQ